MSPQGSPSPPLTTKLKDTTFLGIRLRVFVLACIVFFIVLVFLVIFLFIIHFCCRKSKSLKPVSRLSKNDPHKNFSCSSSTDMRLLSRRISEIEMNIAKLQDHQSHLRVNSHDEWFNEANAVMTRYSGSTTDHLADLEPAARHSDVWRGRRFSLKEIEVATNGFANENVIGNGDHAVTYRGILLDTTRVAVKRLFSSSEPEDHEEELELIGHARHKNVVKLLGYCLEGGFRMLVSEYVDNGNLHQWLHGCPEQFSPLTWAIRMDIIQGIAKGLAYLHEDLDPKIVHQGLKSSNVLLDRHWNPKISDFGIAKLSGYLTGECTSSRALNERTDVYSFGVIVMEIVSGRPPVDHNQPQIYLIDWFKSMVANQKIMYVVDPKLSETPSLKELKRLVLLALRCVDPDTKHRPTMGEVIHMLEPRDLLLNDESWPMGATSNSPNHLEEGQTFAGSEEKDFNRESNKNHYQKMMPNDDSL